MTETNEERLARIAETWKMTREVENIHPTFIADMQFLFERAEQVQELEINLDHGAKVAVKIAEKLHLAREENKRLREQNSDTDEIKVTKYRKGEPTVIDWNGERWIKDTQTTFKGGVQRGKQNKSTK